jgi:N-acyl amino acid synthase of PEP-CTERM/exosortase system
MTKRFQVIPLDGAPLLLEKSYRLRYQVYCVERRFLPADDYPNHMEIDEFDRRAVHVGVMDADGELAGTARVVKGAIAGLPVFRHCSFFPGQATLHDPANTLVEVSRLAISRRYTRRRDDVLAGDQAARVARAGSASRSGERRDGRDDLLGTLLKGGYQAAKRMGATHLLAATEKSLQRWLAQFGFPFMVVGPESDYYGCVAPYIMSLAAFDQLILERRIPALDDFHAGLEPELIPRLAEPDLIRAGAPVGKSRVIGQVVGL